MSLFDKKEREDRNKNIKIFVKVRFGISINNGWTHKIETSVIIIKLGQNLGIPFSPLYHFPLFFHVVLNVKIAYTDPFCLYNIS